MSRTLSAPRWGKSAAMAGAIALLLTALVAVGLAPRANADFTTSKCAGPDILGRGASFARDAHTWFNQNFKVNYCAGTPGAGVIDVAYDAAGSGAGRTAVKVRNDTPRFGMTDDPPSATEIEQMNKGTGSNPPASDVNPNDNGKIQVVPAAVGAVAPLVNFPQNCNPELLGAAYRTVSAAEIAGDATKKALLRVRFPKAKFEEVWAQGEGTGLKWSDVFPELAGDTDCEVPVIRVVRFDESGTSFAFKDYLRTINPGRGWTTTYATEDSTALTRKWPGAIYGNGGQCGATNAPGKEADATDHLTSGCANGNGPLTAKLVEVDGSIGYSDISTARNNSPSLAINPALASAPTTPYWTQVQNGSEVFTEPTANANGFRNDGAKGANCKETEFKNVPADTYGNWSPTSGVNSLNGYGICTLTYGLVFQDNSAVWGDTPAEEAKAKTVKDYWLSIVSASTQSGLTPADYAPLPTAILAISKAGIEGIGWKGGTGEPGPKEEVVVDPKKTDTGTTQPQKPSNVFSLLRKRISSKTGGATISVKLPGAGQLVLVATARVGKKQVKVGRVVLSANQAGTFDLKLNPSAAAKQQLKKKGSLKVSLALTFTPTGGDANTDTDTVTLRLAKKRKG
jgi:ABC-type phosphate transport system substrate-binding protein